MTRTDFDPAAPDVNAYALLTAMVVPRPIAWVSTVSAAGVGNLAPHSFFTVASADPPIVAISSIGFKDTVRNVQETGELTVNLSPHAMIEDVNDSSARFDPGADEAGELGIAMRPSHQVAPPAVAGSPGSLECRLHSIVELGDARLILAEVVWITVADEVLVDGSPSYERLALVSRLGGVEWGLPGPTTSITRPGTPADIAPRS